VKKCEEIILNLSIAECCRARHNCVIVVLNVMANYIFIFKYRAFKFPPSQTRRETAHKYYEILTLNIKMNSLNNYILDISSNNIEKGVKHIIDSPSIPSPERADIVDTPTVSVTCEEVARSLRASAAAASSSPSTDTLNE